MAEMFNINKSLSDKAVKVLLKLLKKGKVKDEFKQANGNTISGFCILYSVLQTILRSRTRLMFIGTRNSSLVCRYLIVILLVLQIQMTKNSSKRK